MYEFSEDLDIVQIVTIKLADNSALLTASLIIPKRIWLIGSEACKCRMPIRFQLNSSYGCVGCAIDVLEVHLGSSDVGSKESDLRILDYPKPDGRD